METGVFIYEIGTIENIPLSQIEYIGNTQGISINREYEYSTNVSERYAENIARSISNATVKSSEWTLSEDWNKVTSATNEHDEEIGKTHTITDSENNTDSSKYYISDAVRIRGFDKNTFRGNTNIKGIFMSKYISEIPDNAFEGCTSLEKVIALGVSKIGDNAFKDCTSLQPFTVDKYIDSLGNNAFKNAFGINVMAKNESIADSAIHSGAKNMFLDISEISGNFNNRKIEISPDTYYFAIVSNDRTYVNLQIDSHATITLISNIIFIGNTDTPLKIDSEAVILSKVKVQNCPGFALILSKPDTDLYLFGTTELSSLGENTLISRNINCYKFASDVAGTLKVKGKYLLCDKITTQKMIDISNGEIVIISEEQFRNMISSIMVSFDANGGTLGNADKSCNYGQTYGTLPVPMMNNYNFDGWYTQKNGGSRITENTIVSVLANQTLYAHWNAKQATVYFNANGGNVSTGSKTVTFNSNYKDMPVPTRSNYNFGGWYTAANGGTKVTNNTVVSCSDNHTLYAHWNAKKFTVTFNANGGSVSYSTKTVQYGCKYGDMPIPKRDYYNFSGWFNDNSVKITSESIANTSCDHNLTARWELKGVSGWVKADQIPSGAQIINRKWSYTEKSFKDSRNTSENGYKLSSSEWIWCGSGSQNYANFPDGFDKNSWYYQNWNRQPFEAYENATNKRVVNNKWSGKFDTNELALELTMIAYNILRMLGQETVNQGKSPAKRIVSRKRIRTVIQNIIHFAGQLKKHARRLFLSISRSNAWANAFLGLVHRFTAC